MKRTCRIDTPLGEMVALVEGEALAGLWFVGQKYAPPGMMEWDPDGEHQVLAKLGKQLSAYFSGQPEAFDLPLAPQGTPFQKAVWALLRTITPGEVVTYGALARQVAAQRAGVIPSAQAVGGAVGHNPISIVIPCHRVVGATGALTGYAGGLERKAALLELENGCALFPQKSRP